MFYCIILNRMGFLEKSVVIQVQDSFEQFEEIRFTLINS